jgi:hypothetical protein
MNKLSIYAKFVILLIIAAVVRLVMVGRVPLGGDEAYYWIWSKHLSWGYYDHPPMISFIMRLFEGIGGNSTLTIRLASVVMAAIASLVTYKLALAVSRSERAAFLAGLMTIACPLISLKALEISPDSTVVALSIAYIYVLYLAIFENRSWAWALSGIVLGLALLTKLTALLLPVSLLIYLLIDRKHRFLMARPWPYISVLIGALVFSPFLVWCAHNDWITFRFHFVMRVSSEAYAVKNRLPQFLGEQTALISPFLFVLSLISLVTVLIRKDENRGKYLFLGAFGALPILAFALVSLRSEVFPHWTMAGYPPLFILSAIAFVGWEDSRNRFKAGFVKFSIGFGIALCCLAYFALVSPGVQAYFVKAGVVNEIYSYESLTQKIHQAVDGKPNMFVLTDSYARSASLTYYTKRPAFLIARTQIMGMEFLRWQDFNLLLGRDALYIDNQTRYDRHDIQEYLTASFASLDNEQVWNIYLTRPDGKTYLAHRFFVTVCRNLRKSDFYDEKDWRLLRSLHSPDSPFFIHAGLVQPKWR